jgi:hypothetical protein
MVDAIRTLYQADMKWLGKEPDYTGKQITTGMLLKAYSWYNYFHTTEDAKKWVLEYLKNTDQSLYKIIKTVPDQHFTTLGWLCRLEANGGILSQNSIDWRIKKLKELSEKYSVEEKEKGKPNIQNYISDQVNERIGDLEEMIDKNNVVDIYQWLQNNNVRGPQSRKIFDYYKPLQTELKSILDGDAPADLKEGYRNISKKDVKSKLEQVTLIIDDCFQVTQNSKIKRVPRKKKKKSVEKVVSKLNYLEKDDSLKVQSISPTKIVGASTFWVFNVKTRKLGVYTADHHATLNIKGTTILGYHEATSVQKKLRKPDKILQNLVSCGKVGLRKIMDDIKAKPSPLSGRINKDCLLLRITE